MGVAGLVGLKKRINSIQSTRKLTRAMALVATSKLKKVRKVLSVNNDYFYAYKEVIAQILPSISEESVYLTRNSAKKKLVIVVGSDTGMCGSYNNVVADYVVEKTGNLIEDYDFLVLGEKCKSVCRRHKLNVIEYKNAIGDVPEIDSAKEVFEFGLSEFSKGNYSEVSIVYTWFKNTMIREVKSEVILPLSPDNFKSEQDTREFDIEGDRESLIEVLIPGYCECMIHNSVLNAKASEHSVRAETMNAATKNADDLCARLKIKYNRIRQGAITQEITEIVGGVEAQG